MRAIVFAGIVACGGSQANERPAQPPALTNTAQPAPAHDADTCEDAAHALANRLRPHPDAAFTSARQQAAFRLCVDDAWPIEVRACLTRGEREWSDCLLLLTGAPASNWTQFYMDWREPRQ